MDALEESVNTNRSRWQDMPAREIALNIVVDLATLSHSGMFKQPVSSTEAEDYYHESVKLTTSWDTAAICFEYMLDKADQGGYGEEDEKCRIPCLIERDFNTIIHNACIYNPPEHEVNMEAKRLFKEAQPVFQRSYRKMLHCRICNSDHSSEDNLLDICDMCCEGVHQKCNPSLNCKETAGLHPFRGDEAWFCCGPCKRSFAQLERLHAASRNVRGIRGRGCKVQRVGEGEDVHSNRRQAMVKQEDEAEQGSDTPARARGHTHSAADLPVESREQEEERPGVGTRGPRGRGGGGCSEGAIEARDRQAVAKVETGSAREEWAQDGKRRDGDAPKGRGEKAAQGRGGGRLHETEPIEGGRGGETGQGLEEVQGAVERVLRMVVALRRGAAGGGAGARGEALATLQGRGPGGEGALAGDAARAGTAGGRAPAAMGGSEPHWQEEEELSREVQKVAAYMVGAGVGVEKGVELLRIQMEVAEMEARLRDGRRSLQQALHRIHDDHA